MDNGILFNSLGPLMMLKSVEKDGYCHWHFHDSHDGGDLQIIV